MATEGPTDQHRRIVCVGQCVLDVIHVLDHYPPQDVKKHTLMGYWQRGGNASNNVTVLGALRAPAVEFLGMLSASEAFGFLSNDCRKRGIIIENCPTTDIDPPVTSVVLNEATGSRTIIISNAGFPSLEYEHLSRLQLNKSGWIHFEGLKPEPILKIIQDIRNYNKTVKDPKNRIRISMDLEKCNEEILVLGEAADFAFLGKDLANHLGWTNPEEAAKGLHKRFKPNHELNGAKAAIICPWGADGAGCVDSQGNYSFVPSKVVPVVVDSLGAGDTFAAGVIYALQELNKTLPEAVRFGHAVAGYKLGYRGYDNIRNFSECNCSA